MVSLPPCVYLFPVNRWPQVLVKLQSEGKYVVEVDKEIDITKCTPNTRVALRHDSYALHKILPTKVDPLVSLMKVEKVPDSTYDMVGGLDRQIQELREVCERHVRVGGSIPPATSWCGRAGD
jgi:26S proteasome regulatory subunit T6